MPTPLKYKLPMTNDADEFECMVRDYFRKTYKFVQLYGRKGQKQNGIDIIVANNCNEMESYIAVQCKNFSPSVKDIDKIINKIVVGNSNSKYHFYKIIIAMGTQRDTEIQDYILQMKNQLNIPVEPLFLRAMRKIAMLAWIFVECREGQIPRCSAALQA